MSSGDAFAWWEDKQVAVVVDGDLVRGWVLTCRHVADPAAGLALGQMTIVVLIGDPVLRASYPETVVVDVLDDCGHGRPRNVPGLWPEDDVADVHPIRPIKTSPQGTSIPES